MSFIPKSDRKTRKSPVLRSADHDVNKMVQRHLPPELRPANFFDATVLPEDYLEARNLMLQAQESFDDLPARVRDRFKNDPMSVLTFIADPRNRAEAISLGLIAPPPVPPVASPAAAPPAAAPPPK